jgi:hypothetical protein
MTVDHKIVIKGGQDAGTKEDIKAIRQLVENMHPSDVLAALKKGAQSA